MSDKTKKASELPQVDTLASLLGLTAEGLLRRFDFSTVLAKAQWVTNDFDTQRTSGITVFNLSTLNRPPGLNYGVAIVLRFDATYIVQMAFASNGTSITVRLFWESHITPWRKITLEEIS